MVASYPGQTETLSKQPLAGTFAVGDLISLWTAAGQPGAGITPAGGLTAAVPTSALAGAIGFTNPPSGNSYIPKAQMSSSVIGTLIIYDRLVHCAGITAVASTFTLTGFTVSRPDALGTATEIWLECYVANATAAPSWTANYTNQAGTAAQVSGAVTGRTATPAGLLLPFPLAAGDTGVRAVASVTATGTGTAGTFGVTMIRRLAMIPCALANVAAILDNFMLGQPQVLNSACIAAAFRIGNGTAAPLVDGMFSITQG